MHIDIYDLVIRSFRKELTPAEAGLLNRWITESPANQREYNEICDIWLASAEYLQEENIHNEFDAFAALLKLRETIKLNDKPKARLIKRVLQYAAMIIVLIATGISGYFLRKPDKPVQADIMRIESPIGSRTQIMLSDGTRVWLNGGSVMEVSDDFSKTNRDVIISGEGYFDVMPGNQFPFIVKTTDVMVTVLGTAFNINAYSGAGIIETTLERGSLRIEKINDKGKTSMIVLKPNETAVYNKVQGGFRKAEIVKPELYTSWKDNKLVFRNESFEDLSLKLERWYGVDIIIEDSAIGKFHFNGTFEKENIREVLDIIGHTIPVRYTINHDVIRIRMDKNTLGTGT